MFNIIPLPWCFFLSGVGRAPHPLPLQKPHPPPAGNPAPEAQNDATEAKTHPPKRESETTRSRFLGNFGGFSGPEIKNISPPKGATQQLFQSFCLILLN